MIMMDDSYYDQLPADSESLDCAGYGAYIHECDTLMGGFALLRKQFVVHGLAWFLPSKTNS